MSPFKINPTSWPVKESVKTSTSSGHRNHDVAVTTACFSDNTDMLPVIIYLSLSVILVIYNPNLIIIIISLKSYASKTNIYIGC